MRLLFMSTTVSGRPPYTQLLELALVEMVDGQLTGQDWCQCFRPRQPVLAQVAQQLGLDDAALQALPAFHESLESLLRYTRTTRIALHDVARQRGALQAEFDAMRVGIPTFTTPGALADTLPLLRARQPQTAGHLPALCAHYGLPVVDDIASALPRARSLAQLVQAAGLADSVQSQPWEVQ